MNKDITIDLEHKMSAHCENGATGNLLRFYGVDVSEPMIFGLGAGLAFVYFPFIKMVGAPLTGFRLMPGAIFSRINKALGTKFEKRKFVGKPEKAMQELDKTLMQGTPVGLLVGAYDLTYFPTAFRFHFNAHNIVVFRKKDDKYLVSDSVLENPEWITYDDLKRVRFAKGIMKPHGKMYYLKSVNKNYDLKIAAKKGINFTVKTMTLPIPYIGVNAIKLLSKSIRKWTKKYDSRKASKYLGSVVRMQEEIGTGGAGFRFIYAAFLQEVGRKLSNNELIKASEEMTVIGDLWREFAVDAARVCKFRPQHGETYETVADQLFNIYKKEKSFFKKLGKIKI